MFKIRGLRRFGIVVACAFLSACSNEVEYKPASKRIPPNPEACDGKWEIISSPMGEAGWLYGGIDEYVFGSFGSDQNGPKKLIFYPNFLGMLKFGVFMAGVFICWLCLDFSLWYSSFCLSFCSFFGLGYDYN
jgi:hypothetical protein